LTLLEALLATPRVHDDLLEIAAGCRRLLRRRFIVIKDFNYQPPDGTANARVVFASRARTWELASFADNLTDRQYAYTGGTIGLPLSPVATIAWNIPRARSTGSLGGTYRWNPTH
jgi:hypothetical protein